MNAAAVRLVAFGIALAATFGVAHAVGGAIEPIGVDGTERQHGGEHR